MTEKIKGLMVTERMCAEALALLADWQAEYRTGDQDAGDALADLVQGLFGITPLEIDSEIDRRNEGR